MRFPLFICCIIFALVSSCAVAGSGLDHVEGKASPSEKLIPEFTPTVIVEETATPDLGDEIAYVYNGAVEIVDLTTMISQNISDNGHWPVWSPDGQYLIYERLMDGVPNLYIWDSKASEHKLLVEKACCAAWNSSGSLIAFLSFADYFPLELIQLDGHNRQVLLPATDDFHMITGAYNHPNGRLLWSGDNTLYVPVETDAPNLTPLIFSYNLNENTIDFFQITGFPSESKCSIDFFPCQSPEMACLEAPAQSPDGKSFIVTQDRACAGLISDTPQLFVRKNTEDWKPLEQGTNWSWSPDGSEGVYETYAPCKDGRAKTQNFCLTGISHMNLNTRESQLIIEGGEQPAWRPIVNR